MPEDASPWQAVRPLRNLPNKTGNRPAGHIAKWDGSSWVLALAEIGQSPRERFEAAAAAAGLSGPDAAPMAVPADDGSALLLKYAFNMALMEKDFTVLTPATGTNGGPVTAGILSLQIRPDILRDDKEVSS